MKDKCLYCYGQLTEEIDFHKDCALSFFGIYPPPFLSYSLNEMNTLAKQVVERSIAVPGVQPKLSLSLFNDLEDKRNSRLTVVGALGGNYILKPPSEEYPEMPQNEHVTMLIAEAFGIKTVASSLIRLKSGELSYIIKRIDRTPEGEKIHMIDMVQITEAVDKYKSSVEKIGKALGDYSNNTVLDKIFFMELVLFSFITGNNDMHLKNFSMINTDGKWLLAPAYDLINATIINPTDKEEMALTIQGKKSNLNRANFEAFGIGMGLSKKQLAGVFKRMKKNKENAIKWIESSFLSDGMKTNYLAVLEERYHRLNIG